jgi:cell volume regulation protein A
MNADTSVWCCSSVRGTARRGRGGPALGLHAVALAAVVPRAGGWPSAREVSDPVRGRGADRCPRLRGVGAHPGRGRTVHRWTTIRPTPPPRRARGGGHRGLHRGYRDRGAPDPRRRLAARLLVGAILAPTDAAAVFSILRRLPLPTRLTGILEAESGLNDAPSVIVVVALTAQIAQGDRKPLVRPGRGRSGAAAGRAVVGVLVGWLGSIGLRRVALPASGCTRSAWSGWRPSPTAPRPPCTAPVSWPPMSPGWFWETSGCPTGPRPFLRRGTGVDGQIGLFVLLGLIASPGRLADDVWPAIGVGLALALVGDRSRWSSSLVWFRVPWREQAFLSWTVSGARSPSCGHDPDAAGLAGSAESSTWCSSWSRCSPWCRVRRCPGWPAAGPDQDVCSVDLDVEVSRWARYTPTADGQCRPRIPAPRVEIFELRLRRRPTSPW